MGLHGPLLALKHRLRQVPGGKTRIRKLFHGPAHGTQEDDVLVRARLLLLHAGNHGSRGLPKGCSDSRIVELVRGAVGVRICMIW